MAEYLPNPSQDNLDYQHALSVMEEARMSFLGESVLDEAEEIVDDCSVNLPKLVEIEAETITKEAAFDRAMAGDDPEYRSEILGKEAEDYLADRDAKHRLLEQAKEAARRTGRHDLYSMDRKEFNG